MARGFPRTNRIFNPDAVAPAFKAPTRSGPANNNYSPPRASNENFRPASVLFEPAGISLADALDLARALGSTKMGKVAMLGFKLGKITPWGRVYTALELAYDYFNATHPHGYTGPGWSTLCNYNRGGGGQAINPLGCQVPVPFGQMGTYAPGGVIQTGPRAWGISYALDWYLRSSGVWTHKGMSNWQLSYPSGYPNPQPWLPGLQTYVLPRVRHRPNPSVVPQFIPAPSPVMSPAPMKQPEPMPIPVPDIPPMLDPWQAPIQAPYFSPTTPIPWRWLPDRRPDPAAAPSERTEWGPKPGLNQNPNRDLDRDLVVDSKPGSSTRPIARPLPRHAFRPPRKGEKERKLGASGEAYRGIARAFGKLTEGSDLVDSFWDALPEGFRKAHMAKRHGKKPKLADKLEHLYKHWDKVDLKEAIKNAAQDQLQDAVFGKLGRASQAEHWGNKPTGRGVPNLSGILR